MIYSGPLLYGSKLNSEDTRDNTAALFGATAVPRDADIDNPVTST